jgi:hypothetical protein
MRDSDSNRSAVFRQAYWARVEEPVDLADTDARDRVIAAARAARLGRRALRRFGEAASAPGPLSIDMTDEIAKRYGPWETRRIFDSGRYPALI